MYTGVVKKIGSSNSSNASGTFNKPKVNAQVSGGAAVVGAVRENKQASDINKALQKQANNTATVNNNLGPRVPSVDRIKVTATGGLKGLAISVATQMAKPVIQNIIQEVKTSYKKGGFWSAAGTALRLN